MSVIRSYFFCFLAIDNDIMRKMCTLITSKGTDIDENIANQNHATRTRTPKPGYLNLSKIRRRSIFARYLRNIDQIFPLIETKIRV